MDFARVHTGVRCADVVPFGYSYQPIIPGSYVQDVAGISGPTSRQIAMAEGGFVIVRHSIFRGWSDGPVADLICLGWHGQPATLEEIDASSGPFDLAMMTTYLRHYAADVFIARRHDDVTTARALAALVRARRCDLTGIPYRCATCDLLTSASPSHSSARVSASGLTAA